MLLIDKEKEWDHERNKVSFSFYVKILGDLFKVASLQWASTIYKNRFLKTFTGFSFKTL